MTKKYETIESIYDDHRTRILRAKRIFDNLPVILKISFGLFSALERRTKLEHEFEIGKTLLGKRLLTPLALEQDNKESILVLPDDKMSSLDLAIPADGFGLQKFFTLAIEITSALEQLHSQGVIHRDINPTNIIVNGKMDSIKLIDFGLATKISEELMGFEPPVDLHGSIPFISPEQTGRVNKPVDSRSDLYSLGVSLYKLITGRVPFDSEDPGEIIYSHIAKTPIEVCNIRRDIPEALSMIIEKLLTKSPAKRYQSASGLLKDILLLQKAGAAGMDVTDFTPGKQEAPSKIALLGKLYGRDKEISILQDGLEKCDQAGRVVLISGAAGTGKTALVRELYGPITSRDGFFLSGKFDQLRENTAYIALSDAFEDFVSQCSRNSADNKPWKELVQSSVGEFGQVLVDIVPGFHKLLGEQAEVALVSPLETVARRNLVFLNLIKDICKVGQAVVIFIDDLQWSDSASLSLLEAIIANIPSNLMLILSYRDKDLLPAHQAHSLLGKIDTLDSHVTRLHLENLPSEAVSRWIEDLVPDGGQRGKELINQVMRKTDGNPLFVASMLQAIIDKNLIKIDGQGTVVDTDAIAGLPADNDLVEHLIRKIELLGQAEQKFLIQVSVLGNRFSLETLEAFLEKHQSEFHSSIQAAVDAHLLIKSGNMLMFSHDRVQQAAGEMLDTDAAKRLHLKAGKNIRKALCERYSDDVQPDLYLDHFNAAAELITDKQERMSLAQLNMKVGKRLKANAAHQAAEGYFSHALSFMPDDPFESSYKMAIELFTEFGETLFLNLKYEHGQEQFDKVIKHSRSPLDSAEAYVKQIYHYSAHNQAKRAMKIALHSLETLGVKLPKRFLVPATVLGLLQAKRQLKGIKPEGIPNLPITEDLKVLAQMKLLSAASVAAYIGNPDYLPLVILKMIKISLADGICSESPFAFMGYASLICALGNTDSGYAYGKAALSLMNMMGAKKLGAKLPYMFGVFIQHFKEPALRTLDLFETAINKGLEVGDYEFASYAANDIMYLSFYFGKSIESLIHQYPKQHKILAKFSKERSILMAKYWNQLLLTLNDPTSDGISVSGELIDEKTLFPLLEQRQDLTSLAICMVGKMQLAYLAGDYVIADTARKKAFKLIKAVQGTIFVPIFHFFSALSCIAQYRQEGKDPSVLDDASRSLRELKKYGADAPDNYFQKAQLVEAELMSLEGKQTQALKLYELAIGNADMAKNQLDLGLAHECLGRYLASIGLDFLGANEISHAISVFHEWGARNKARRLSDEFGMAISHKSSILGSPGSARSSADINANLDVETLAETIKSLSSDFKFESVLTTLLEAVMKSSGATRVMYINYDQKGIEVIAQKGSGSEVEILDRLTVADQKLALPVDLIEKCTLASCAYVLENTGLSTDRSNDTIVGSVLIIPLKRHESVRGIIYLENSLMNDAFRQDHVQFLSLLAQQAAIAIENALMFENLNAERDFSANIIGNSPNLICGVTDEGIITFINPVVERVTGYSKSELIGKQWWKLLYPGGEFEQVKRLLKAFSKGQILDYEMTLTTKNGKKRTIAWTSMSTIDPATGKDQIIAFGDDITEKKRAEEEKSKLEEQYRHSQKMEAVGRLAGGIAHDFNNVLCAITGNASLTLEDLAPDDPVRESVEQIASAADRAAKLTKQLLAFSRKQVMEPKAIKISQLIENIRPMLVRIIGEDIVLKFSSKDQEGLILVDPGQMEQVILNLAINAKDAMPDGGQLAIQSKDIDLDKEYCDIHDAKPGPYVMLSVNDTGLGMSQEIREKIFEPFFTTKKIGQGTGLGLATVFGIVEQSGGFIDVYSEPSEGTIFRLYFPLTDKVGQKLPAPAKQVIQTGGTETILVVEDEEIVRNMAKNMLERFGYKVLTASSGTDAIMLVQRHEGNIDLLLTDLVMPNMNGHELALRITKLRPDTKVLYSSGYTQDLIAHHGVLDEGIEFISKPFSMDTLAAKVRKVLDSLQTNVD